MKKQINRPVIFSNFVVTLDGKVQMLENSDKYWPIGSETDFQNLLDLRAKSDILIHGRGTALAFRHIDRIASDGFKKRREKFKKPASLPYMVISNNATDDLIFWLKDPKNEKAILVTAENAKVSEKLAENVQVLRFGKDKVDLQKLAAYLGKEGYKKVLMEGGPTLFGSFLEENLIDELYLTIAPKIFGNLSGKTLSLVEGVLFPPNEVKHLKLISVKKIGDEVFLHYNLKT